MYAVIETGGKQYRVTEGDKIFVEKLDIEAGSSISIKEVLVIEKDDQTLVGKPYVTGASVRAEVVENGKAKKVVIYKYKAKKDSKKKQGHRQPYTQLEIKSISMKVSRKMAEDTADAVESEE